MNPLRPNSSVLFPVFKTLSWFKEETNIYAEIAAKIFSKLGASDLCQAEGVCQEWKQLIQASNLWKKLYFQKASRAFSPEKESPIDTLPSEMLLKIFSFLPVKELGFSQQVCKSWYKLGADTALWKCLLGKTYPALSAISDTMKISPKDLIVAQSNIKTNRAQIIDLLPLAWEKGHKENAQAAFSSNGKHVIIFNNDLPTFPGDIVSLWDANTRKCLQVWEGINWSRNLFLSSGSQWLIIKGSKSTSLWDANTGECLKVLEEDSLGTEVFFSPNKERLVTRGSFIRLWDAKTGECLQSLERRETKDWSLQTPFSPDGKWLAIDSSKSVSLWDARTGKCLHTLEKPEKESLFTKISFSPDSESLVINSNESISLWNANTGECLHIWEEINGQDSGIFSPDSQQIVIDDYEFIRLWDIKTREWVCTLDESVDVSFISFSSDSQRLIVDNQSLCLWDAKAGKKLKTLDEELEECAEIILFSPDNQRIITHTADLIRLWDANTGECLQTLDTLEKEEEWAPEISFSSNSEKVVIHFIDSIHLWDAQTGKCLKNLEEPGDFEQAFFSSNSQWLVISDRHNVQLWDTQTGKYLHTLGKHFGFWGLKPASFSPNGGQLLIGMKVFDFFPAKSDSYQLAEPPRNLENEERAHNPTEKLVTEESKKRKARSAKSQEDSSNISAAVEHLRPSLQKKRKKGE
jgi:WD40 repeat protein